MAAARGNSDFVEFRMKEDRAGGVLPACGVAIDSHARNIVIRVFRSDGLVPKNAIRKSGVLEIFPADVMKCLGTIRRAHAVHLYGDEPKVSQRGKPPRGAE